MIRLFRREWGAILFVATVLIGAVVVGISFLVGAGGHTNAVPTPPPCPSYTPWQTPVAGAASTSTPFAFGNCPAPPTEPPASASPTPTPSPTATPSPSASASASASPTATPASG